MMGRNVLFNALFLACTRVTWSMAIAWIIFTCFLGLHKYLNTFLSSKYWIPITRMGLSIYLIHPVVQFNIVMQQSDTISFNFPQMVSYWILLDSKKVFLINHFRKQLANFTIEVIITIFCAIVMFLTVEEPFSLIGKFITRRNKKTFDSDIPK